MSVATEERKQEIKTKLIEQLKEAYSHEIRREEILHLVNQIYDNTERYKDSIRENNKTDSVRKDREGGKVHD